MGERTRYAPGTFSWTDLNTTDQDGAKEFYTELFGWQPDDQPVGDGVVYSVMRLNGHQVAAISPQPEQQRQAGVPPMWNSYITVESADEALARATQLGATVHAPAFDVLDVGRMGVVQDPQGAFFEVWEPRQSIGATFVNTPGALTWNELASRSVADSVGFYRDLFGWTTERMESSEIEYHVIKNADGHSNGGIRTAMGEEPSYWLVYFGAEDVDEGIARAVALGGTELVGTTNIGPGRFGILQDPQGAVFALYSGEFDE